MTGTGVGREPWRILHVIDSIVQGGAEQLLVTAASHSDERYALFVHALHGVDDDSSVARSLRALDVPLHCSTNRGRHDPRHVLDVIKTVRQDHIDVVHGHLPYGTAVAAAAGRLTGRPVVATLHGRNDTDHPGGRLTRSLHRAALRRGASVVIACAPELEARAQSDLGIAFDRLVTVPNGIETSRPPADADAATQRRALLGAAGGPLVVAVGNVLPAKGHDVLVEAAAILEPRFPGLRVAIVGRLDHGRGPVEQRIEELGQGERVTLAGPSTEVAAIVAAADLFVLPSLREGLPLALLEALASGTPVVATAVGGIPGVIRDGVHGRLVPPGDAEALAAAIAASLESPAEAGAMAAAARRVVVESYSADAFAERTAAVYDRLLRGQRPVNSS